MTRQQAGVSAIRPASDHQMLCEIWDALLATAPPEQGAQQQPCDCQQLCEKLSNPLPPGRFCMAEAAQEKMRAEPPQAGWQPPPASDGALTERITDYLSGGGLFNPELADHNRVRDLLRDCREALVALAAHDQKVRAEALEEAADCCDGAQRDKWQGEKAGLTVEQMRLWNKWVTDLGDEIRALAAPAASKPEAAHE